MSYIVFKVNMCKEYKLRLTMQNIITLEDTFNKDIYTVISELATGTVPLDTLLQILKQSMMSYGYVLCDNDIYKVYDEYLEEGHNIIDLYNIIVKIFEHAGFFNNGSEEYEEKNNNTYPKEGENPIPTDKCFLYLRDKAIECEMEEDKYWASTYGEVLRYIIAYNNKVMNDVKMSLRSAHLTADLVGYSVARLLDKEAKLPDITDLYPDLFKEERKELEKIREKERLNKLKENFANLTKICVVKDDENNIKKGE